jgi:hypothetical protein
MAPPIMGGQMMPMQQQQPQGTPGGFPQPGMQGMQPGMQPGMPGMGPPPGMGGSQPNKTVLLQATDGIVSVAQRGGAAIPSAGGPIVQGATPLFWAVSLVIGIAIGVVAYVIVLQT